jgi:DNA invertase Pin-like site-specific DNA recombinase
MVDVLRILGAIRQSKTKDRAVSPVAQRAQITRWAEDRGYKLVKFTEDLSRSGKVSAFKRPELGPYLTNPLLVGTWDVLVTTKIDRACRNTRDFLTIMDWCKDNGKQYVSLKEQIDMSTAQGRENGRNAASRAEWERDIASERRLETLEELREQGRWAGGIVPFGLRADVREDGYYLVPDIGGNADVAHKMADMAIAGASNPKIQDWLNENGHLNSIGKPWFAKRVGEVLHSSGMKEILGEEKDAELKLALQSRAKHSGWNSGQNLLIRVAFCMLCGAPLYSQRKPHRPTGGHYRCATCGVYRSIKGMDTDVERLLLDTVGKEQMYHLEIELGDQRLAERYDLMRQIKALEEITAADTSAIVAQLKAQLQEITDSIQPAVEHWEGTGQTIAGYWSTLDTIAKRNRFLRDANIRVEADRDNLRFIVTQAGTIQVADLAA